MKHTAKRVIAKTATTGKAKMALLPLALASIQMAAMPAWAADAVDAKKVGTLSKVSVTADAEKAATENTKLLNADSIEQNQVRNLEDLVRYEPGVDVDNTGRFGSNGFVIRGLDGDRVAITVDGLSLAETLNPASYAPYEFFSVGRGGIDVDAMKSVQIVKGADSISAGSGSLGAAVMFVTKDPSDYLKDGKTTYANIKWGYASASDENTATATVADRTGAWDSLVVYTKREGHETESFYSGDRNGVAGTAREIPDPLDYDNGNLLAKLIYNLDEEHRIGVVVERFDAVSQLDNQTRLSSAYLTRTSDDESERTHYGAFYQQYTSTALFDELEVRYDLQNTYNLGETWMTIPTGCPKGATSAAVAPCLRTEHRDYEQEQQKLQVKLEKQLGAHQISYGANIEQRNADYADVKTRYVGTTSEVGVGWPQYGADFVPRTDVDNYSMYARDLVTLVDDRLQLNAGLRFDSYQYTPHTTDHYTDKSTTIKETEFSSPSWQLGASWKLAPEHSIWAQAGSGFRAPTIENMFFSPTTSAATEVSTNTSVDLWDTVANPNLEAETSRTFEVGYRFEAPRQQLGVSVYHNTYDNYIDYANFIRNPDILYKTCVATACTEFKGDVYSMLDNIGEVTVKGVELKGQWLITDSIRTQFAASRSTGEEQDGTPLQSINPASATLGLGYQAPSAVWGAQMNYVYSQSKKASDAVLADSANATQIPPDYFTRYNDSFGVLDLQAFYQVTPQFRVNAGAYNLLDEEYIRWQRIRFVNQGSPAGGARGGVSADGIHRYTEPGRNYKLTLAYTF